MTALLSRLWPKTLAGRLTLYLVLALAVSQAGLTVFLNSQRDVLVAVLLHNQSLNQTVTLARLLETYPADQAATLTGAFRSRQSCASIGTEAPAVHAMTQDEQQLANALRDMLHGVNAGVPVVAIETGTGVRQLCADEDGSSAAATQQAQRDRDVDRPGEAVERGRFVALTTDVPLSDGRWLAVSSRVDVPGDFDPTTLITFVLSAIAIAVVAALVVRRETRSLRTLADASDRFGRGEAVPPLPTSGPVEVTAATRAFNTMQTRLSEFIGARLRLLASVSHDLRTPLTTLRLKAEFIEDEAMRDDLVATIDELVAISETTLAFTRAEATAEDTRVLGLSELVREVAEEFRLTGDPVEEAQMDAVQCACRPVALKRAVRNLVSNAVRYGKIAKLTVRRDDGHALVLVDDEGPGIPPDRIEEAFQPFVRLEPSRSAETGGIGLGLAIARGIVTAHGGTLTLSNLPAGGLRAEMALPL